MLKRTCYSDNMKEGKEIVLTGWVHERRDLGGIKFIYLEIEKELPDYCPKKKVSEEIFKLMDSLGENG